LSQYKRGRNFEYRVKKYLESLGFDVWRLAGSKPVDLQAFDEETIIVVECKGHRIGEARLKEIYNDLKRKAKNRYMISLIFYKKKGGRLAVYPEKVASIVFGKK